MRQKPSPAPGDSDWTCSGAGSCESAGKRNPCTLCSHILCLGCCLVSCRRPAEPNLHPHKFNSPLPRPVECTLPLLTCARDHFQVSSHINYVWCRLTKCLQVWAEGILNFLHKAHTLHQQNLHFQFWNADGANILIICLPGYFLTYHMLAVKFFQKGVVCAFGESTLFIH